MRSLEQIEHPKPIEYQAWGKDIKYLFVNAAEGLFSLITGGKTHNKAGMGFLVYKKLKFEYHKERFECEAPDQETLLQFWLTDLIVAYQKRDILFQDFDIQKLTETSLKASCYGPLIDDVAEPKIKIEEIQFKRLEINKEASRIEANIEIDLS